ncbi:MAG: hypothetical protein M1128_02575 [Candidatus Marsarchaeota archaeon]|nr:hypothetical protein [Candidatus Marsarchaeota archaeon]
METLCAFRTSAKAYNAHANKLNHVAKIARKNNFEGIGTMKAKAIGRHSAREAIENRASNMR